MTARPWMQASLIRCGRFWLAFSTNLVFCTTPHCSDPDSENAGRPARGAFRIGRHFGWAHPGNRLRALPLARLSGGHAAIELCGFILGNAERLPSAAGIVLGQQNNLAQVLRIVRNLAIDGLHD